MTTHTVVHLLRHGEVENPTKILYGRLPGFRLSPLGEQMAKAAAQALAPHDITVFVAAGRWEALGDDDAGEREHDGDRQKCDDPGGGVDELHVRSGR